MKPPAFSTEENKSREKLYMIAWRILARFGVHMLPEEKSPILSIISAFYRDRQFDPLAVSHLDHMKSALKQQPHHPYLKD